MAHEIGKECVACGACEPECPVDAIIEGAKRYKIDSTKCVDCAACARLCPMDAIEAPH